MLRDGHRLRERIELSLDDRQVAALAVGALLLLAGMFALGLLIGMQVARRSPQPALVGDLAALDEQRAQAHRSASSRPQPKPQGPADDAAEMAQPREPLPAASSVAHVDPAPRKEMPAPPATVNVAATRPVAVPALEPADLPAPPKNVGKYTVQLGASPNRAEALQLASRSAAAGLKVYVVEVRLPGKGTWYRVRLGAFAAKDAADRYRRDVERELRTSAVVMPTR